MIRITIEIDGVETVTATLDNDAASTIATELRQPGLSEQMIEGGATAAGAAPVVLAAAPDIESVMIGDISDAGSAAVGAQ